MNINTLNIYYVLSVFAVYVSSNLIVYYKNLITYYLYM